MKRINLPTWLTLSRIVITPVIVLLLYFPNKITCLAATVLYVAASISDYLDGKLARSTSQVTSFGKFLDPLADKVLNCSMLIIMSYQGWIHAWVVIIIVCRELMVTGLRAIAADEGIVMGADKYGKVKTVFQGIALLPLTLQYPWFGVDWPLIGEIVLYIALVLTVFSGFNYLNGFYKFWLTGEKEAAEVRAAASAPSENSEPASENCEAASGTDKATPDADKACDSSDTKEL